MSISEIKQTINTLKDYDIMMVEQRTLNYKVLLRKEPEGGYTVLVPSLPGCVTYGDTVEDAIRMAKEAIELNIESLRERGEPIPTEDETLEYTVTVTAYA